MLPARVHPSQDHRLRLTLRSALLLLVLTAACSDTTTAPHLVAGAVGWSEQPGYATWWSQMESCSGRQAPISRISWYWTPDQPYFTYQGVDYDGYWFRYRHQIVLGRDHVQDSAVVRHEMLHDLLDRGDHPAEFFVDRCGSLMWRDRSPGVTEHPVRAELLQQPADRSEWLSDSHRPAALVGAGASRYIGRAPQ
jgi:hypothetical protein